MSKKAKVKKKKKKRNVGEKKFRVFFPKMKVAQNCACCTETTFSGEGGVRGQTDRQTCTLQHENMSRSLQLQGTTMFVHLCPSPKLLCLRLRKGRKKSSEINWFRITCLFPRFSRSSFSGILADVPPHPPAPKMPALTCVLDVFGTVILWHSAVRPGSETVKLSLKQIFVRLKVRQCPIKAAFLLVVSLLRLMYNAQRKEPGSSPSPHRIGFWEISPKLPTLEIFLPPPQKCNLENIAEGKHGFCVQKSVRCGKTQRGILF